MNSRRVRLRINGIVQGVGFRPYVYRLARTLDLNGFVRNDTRGVVVEVEGPSMALDRFIERLPAEAPPLATCGEIIREEIAPLGGHAFTIAESAASTERCALIAPDVATCRDCLEELFDPINRRFRYPFVNCTNCGPRFTIVEGVPYDRPFTTMSSFEMCALCRAEYEDPRNRRFHAQPNACPVCGPRVRLVDREGLAVPLGDARDALELSARALREGAIIAVKGLGGYHLACRADLAETIRCLRQRKHREEKPFAIMAPNLAAARALAHIEAVDEQLLMSRERPIVLVRRRFDAAVAADVAPGYRDLGLMLPYTPIHHMLLHDCGMPLVMTSGNVSEEPIAYRDADGMTRLSGIADLFLTHDRPIAWPVDDSIVRTITLGSERRPLMLRRSRGYIPMPLSLPVSAPEPLVACGAHVKNTYCVVRERHAWLGPHVGDLENYETLEAFRDGIAHHERLFSVTPRQLAHDAHPEYLSTKYAQERMDDSSRVTVESIQHHHAHLAACLAEHGEEGPAIGVIFDGAGYGVDGTIWGGELLLGDLTHCVRVGHLRPVRMPGGENAVREPWRMACSWLCELSDDATPERPATIVRRIDDGAWRAAAKLVRSGIASPYTTSIGRLLDALSALCGVRCAVSYEGQAAIDLEMLADEAEVGRYDVPLVEDDGVLTLDARPLVRAVLRELDQRVPVATIAGRIHNSIVDVAVRSCQHVAERSGVWTVVLSGGVFQNVLLLERTAAALLSTDFRVLVPERVPPNDGGIALGQAAVAAARAAAAQARIVTVH